MYLRRDGPSHQTTSRFEQCRSTVSWRVWCPTDIALWTTIIVAFMLAMIYYYWRMLRKTDKIWDSEQQKLGDLRRQLSRNVTIPRDDDNVLPKDNHCPHDLSYPDPHLITQSRRESTMTDPVIPTTLLATPAPALLPPSLPKNLSSSRLTALGITFGSSSTLDLRFTQMMQGSISGIISRQASSASNQDISGDHLPLSIITPPPHSMEIATPPPAYYVRDIHSDKL